MPEKKGDWLYYYSNALKMKYAYNQRTGEVMTEDKVMYTKDEIDALKGQQITLALHNLKKAFDGKVINFD
jgi:hypothetical protein